MTSSADTSRCTTREGNALDQPTLENWLRPPYVFWSSRHVSSILRCATIAPAPAPSVRALPRRDDPRILRLPVKGADGAPLDQFLLGFQTDSFVATHNGQIVAEWRAPLVGASEPHNLFSVTKSLTGLLVGALAQAGLVDCSQRVTAYLPELKGGAFDTATVRHLLDMEASYDFVEDYTPGPDLAAYYRAAGYLPVASPEDAGLHRFLSKLRGEKPPAHGQRFRYLTPTTDLLAWVCEAAGGDGMPSLLSKFLWVPAGAEAAALAPTDACGSIRGAGGMSATAYDIVRIGQLIANGGGGVISEEFVHDMLHAGSPDRWAAGDMVSTLPPGGCYRSCFYRPNLDPAVVLGMGIRGQMLYVDVPRQVVICVQSTWDDPDPEPKWHQLMSVCRQVAYFAAGSALL